MDCNHCSGTGQWDKILINASKRWANLLTQPTPAKIPNEVPLLSTLALEILRNQPSSSLRISHKSLPCSVVKKVLPNGFTIIIEHRRDPTKNIPVASIRLISKTGHLHENEDEIGLAHLLEHCMFHGTKNFTGSEIQSLFQSLGCQPGADSNACTDYPATWYKLDNIPTRDHEKLQKCIQLYYEFCTSPQFPLEKLLKERAIVLNELLNRKGLENEDWKHLYSTLYPNTRYISRFGGELSPSIRQADAQELQNILMSFYQREYRADKMELVIIGDFSDIFSAGNRNKFNEFIANIEALYGTIPAPSGKEQALSEIVPHLDHKNKVIAPMQNQLRKSEFSHPQITRESIVFYKRVAKTEMKSAFEKKRELICTQIFQAYLRYLLDVLKNDPENTISNHFQGNGPVAYSDSKLTYLRVGAHPNGAEKALTAYLRAIKQIEVYGVDSHFLDATLKTLKKNLDIKIQTYASAGFGAIADCHRLFFVKGKHVPTNKNYIIDYFIFERLTNQELIDGVKLVARNYINFAPNQDVLCRTLSRGKFPIPNIETILQDQTLYAALPPLPSSSTDISCLTNLNRLLTPNNPVSDVLFSNISTQVWKFSNGLEVVYKQIDSLNKTCFIDLFAPRGVSLTYSNSERNYLNIAIAAFSKLGFTNKKFHELAAAKRDAGLTQEFAAYNNAIFSWQMQYAINDIRSLELVLQILHLKLTDITAIKGDEFAQCWVSIIKELKMMENGKLNTARGQEFTARRKLIFEDAPEYTEFTMEDLEGLNIDKARSLLMSLLQQLSRSRIIITAPKNDSDILTLVNKYIGTLPASSLLESTSIPTLKFTPKKEICLDKGDVANRSIIELYIPFLQPQDPQKDVHTALATEFIQRFLSSKIRREKQMTYGLSCGRSWLSCGEIDLFKIILSHESSKIDDLLQEIFNVLATIDTLEDEVFETYLKDLKSWYTKRDLNDRNNLQVQKHSSYGLYFKGFSIDSSQNQVTWAESMTINDLKEAVHIYLARKDEFKKLTLNPKPSL